MKMLKFLVITGLICISFTVSAQQQNTLHDPLQIAQLHIDGIIKYVPGVTADQESRMVAIERWFVGAAQDVLAGDRANTDVVFGKIQQLSEERNTKMKTVLTTDQYAKYVQTYAESMK
jgi:hypothetical protein